MSGAPAGGAWATVMGNLNTIAVATLTETGCIILAANTKLDELAVNKAKAEGITVLATSLSSFEAALKVYQFCQES
jgi:fructose-1,6-bisphosphatase/sedoheptulose 1,7-bisphosphatase-like protein